MYEENFLSKTLRSFAEEKKWTLRSEYIYGDIDGILFTGSDELKEKLFLTPVPGITAEQKTGLFEVIEANRDAMRLTGYALMNGFLCIRIKNSFWLKPIDLEFILNSLTGFLKDLNINMVGICQKCGKPGAELINLVQNRCCYMHEDCARTVRSRPLHPNAAAILSDRLHGDFMVFPDGSVESRLKGVTFDNRQQLILNLKPRQILKMVHEKENPVDKNIISVFGSKGIIGRLPGEISGELAAKMDSGEQFQCFVVEISGSGNSSLDVIVRIEKSN